MGNRGRARHLRERGRAQPRLELLVVGRIDRADVVGREHDLHRLGREVALLGLARQRDQDPWIEPRRRIAVGLEPEGLLRSLEMYCPSSCPCAPTSR